jgi:hypothetical protein
MSIPFTEARVDVLRRQEVRVSRHRWYGTEHFRRACDDEIAARDVLAALPEQHAELDAWRARATTALHRRRLRRAMTPAVSGHRVGPRCA